MAGSDGKSDREARAGRLAAALRENLRRRRAQARDRRAAEEPGAPSDTPPPDADREGSD